MRTGRKNGWTRDYSTLDEDNYLQFTVYIGVFFASLVFGFNLLVVSCLSVKQKLWRVLLYEFLSGAYGVMLTYKKHRTVSAAVVSGIIGAGAYTISIYREFRRGVCNAVLLVAAVITVLCVLLFFIARRRRNRSVFRYIRNTLFAGLRYARRPLALLALISIFFFPVLYKFGADNVYKVKTASAEKKESSVLWRKTETESVPVQKENIAEYVRYIMQEELWESLPLEKRQEAIVAVIGYEAAELGIPYQLMVYFSEDVPDTIGAYYSDMEHAICLRNDYMREKSGIINLNSAIHEVYHSHQHCVCEVYKKLSQKEKNLLYFSDAAKWCVNFEHYTLIEEDYEKYYNQPLETDARAYSEERLYFYSTWEK